MNNKYKTGSYRVILFDNYGTKLRDLSADPDNFQGAIDTGRSQVKKDHAAHSYVVHRVLANSMDKNERSLDEAS